MSNVKGGVKTKNRNAVHASPKGAKLSLRPIPPTMRGKKRYILFTIVSAGQLSERDVSAAVSESLLRLFGELGTAKTGARLISWDTARRLGILRCSHAHTEECIAALSFISRVGGKEAVPATVRVSGSVAKLRTASG